jgi:hypothetical protein
VCLTRAALCKCCCSRVTAIASASVIDFFATIRGASRKLAFFRNHCNANANSGRQSQRHFAMSMSTERVIILAVAVATLIYIIWNLAI